MAEKKSFALRVSAEMLKEIEEWANDEFRSINGQIEYILNQALKDRKKAKNRKKQDQ